MSANSMCVYSEGVNSKMCKRYWTNDRFVVTVRVSYTAHVTFISLLSWTDSLTLHTIVLPNLSPTLQGNLWIDTTRLHLTNCPHLPALLLSEVSHIHHLLVLLKAVGMIWLEIAVSHERVQ